MNDKLLIVNADDFGMSFGICKGIIYAMDKGIVTSASIMVNTPYLSKLKNIIANNQNRDWGLHVNLIKPKQLSVSEILKQTSIQLDIFKKVLKFTPTHFDYHGGFKFDAKIYFHLRMFALRNKIAFRYDNKHTVNSSFYGLKNYMDTKDDISEDYLVEILENLKSGVTELICHPGYTNSLLTDPYRHHRKIEIQTLISKKVRKVILKNKIKLIDYRDYKYSYASK